MYKDGDMGEASSNSRDGELHNLFFVAEFANIIVLIKSGYDGMRRVKGRLSIGYP
jgi:hypothetical protein